MKKKALAALLDERYARPPTPPPPPDPEPDTDDAIWRRQRVLAQIPGDEYPGEYGSEDAA